MPPNAQLKELFEASRKRPTTPAERAEYRRAFVYGNVAIENPRVTRELVDRVIDRLDAQRSPE